MNERGFTLLEVTIVLLLTSLIGTILVRWQWQQEENLQGMEQRLRQQERVATAIAHLRQDLARSDTLLPRLAELQAGPEVLIASHQERGAEGYATEHRATIVYHLHEGTLKRTVMASDGATLAQPMGRLPRTSRFELLDGRGQTVAPEQSHLARTVQIDGHRLRLGGEAGS